MICFRLRLPVTIWFYAFTQHLSPLRCSVLIWVGLFFIARIPFKISLISFPTHHIHKLTHEHALTLIYTPNSPNPHPIKPLSKGLSVFGFLKGSCNGACGLWCANICRKKLQSFALWGRGWTCNSTLEDVSHVHAGCTRRSLHRQYLILLVLLWVLWKAAVK